MLKNKKILIADHNVINRNIVKTYLVEAEAEVLEAESSSEAFSKLIGETNSMCDAILMDEKLLEREGLKLSAAHKKIPFIKELPIILFSMDPTDNSNIENPRIKDKDVWCLNKPFTREELLDSLVRALHRDDNIIRVGEAVSESKGTATGYDHKYNVLLAEDNELNRQYFINLLKILGISCDIAADGKEAVAACLSKDYDLVFMDCQMPVMDGFEATRRIREAEEGRRHTIIIAVTANAMKGDDKKCYASGMDAYLSKPVDSNRVRCILQQYLRKRAFPSNSPAYETAVLRLVNVTGLDEKDAEKLIREGVGRIRNLTYGVLKDLQERHMKEIPSVLRLISSIAANLRMTEVSDQVLQAETLLVSGSISEVESVLFRILAEF